jgi:Flp pilus assembly protein TadB
MKELSAAMTGALVGLGVVVTWLGLRGGSALTLLGQRVMSRFRPQLALIPLGGLMAFALTGWVALAGAAALAVAVVPGVARPRIAQRNDQEVVDAIATWTEQIRDTIAGARGLEEAIIATAEQAPTPIRAAVSRLAAFIVYGRLDDGLRRFSDDLRHPTADFVVAALSTAHHHQARELGALLSGIAECARDESKMRSRIWVGRARTRTSLRIITGVVIVFVVGLILFNREYLAPFSTTQGQVVLMTVMALFAVALGMMHRLARIETPERFVRKRPGGAG